MFVLIVENQTFIVKKNYIWFENLSSMIKQSLLFLMLLISALSISQKDIDYKNAPITDGSSVYCEYQKATITPPAGYKFINKISSFVNNDMNTSITVASKNNMTYDQYVDALLNSKVENAKLIEKKELENGWFVIFEFIIQDKPVERMMYVTGNEDRVVYAMANYMKKQRIIHYNNLKRSLLTLKY